MVKAVDDLQALGRARLDALAASATLAASSHQGLATELVEHVTASIEAGATVIERMAVVRSFHALVALQSDTARSMIETGVMRWTRMTELQSQMIRAMVGPFQLPHAPNASSA